MTAACVWRNRNDERRTAHATRLLFTNSGAKEMNMLRPNVSALNAYNGRLLNVFVSAFDFAVMDLNEEKPNVKMLNVIQNE